MTDVSTPALILAGIVTAVGTAWTSAYSAYREARHKADRKDTRLVRTRLEAAEAHIRDLEAELERWRAWGEANRPG